MSHVVEGYEIDFGLGEQVSFLHDGKRLIGEVVRVYNTRDNYHVEVDGIRYFVHRSSDEMQRMKT